ncbi:MAG: glycosyltransferase family 2 protein [Roseobacter sp.]
MNDLNLRLPDTEQDVPVVSHPPIGRLLVDQGKIDPQDLRQALFLQESIDAPLGDILIAEGRIDKRDVLSALAVQARAEGADLELDSPDPEMAHVLPVAICLAFGVVPWREDNQALYVATSSPARFAAMRNAVGHRDKPLFPVIVDDVQIQAHQSRLYGESLAHAAASRVPLAQSCRGWGQKSRQRVLLAALIFSAAVFALIMEPLWSITILSLWAVLTLAMNSTLKALALLTHLWPVHKSAEPPPFRMPKVSVLVPLLKEREIAEQLVARLRHLTYPKSLLNVVLVLEAGDDLTRDTIARTTLPDWMTVIEVPEAGGLTTKPRALNYALDFCKGSIIGVWDAEDWPEADQIEKVVTRFRAAPKEVVCLQGILDYYNSRSSWIARCFTIEYAMWWRIIMPGIARLGLVVPLGGTTLFFKRNALEELGGWDAHNVTEDADLGVRLARHGYKTELLQTVTREEATSRMWPWVRQRSRWLKGFLVTYFVHMRNPVTLLREVGLWRFMGLQTIFLAAVSQFATAPLLWSFWITLLGVTHPVEITLGPTAIWSLAVFFLAAEALTLLLGLVATASRDRRHLIPILPTTMIYFALGALAAYKAVWELIRMPFYWDKTQHGVSAQTDPVPRDSCATPPPR